MEDITYSQLENGYQTACALGLFDGVHRGHQLVIKTACNAANENNEKIRSAVFTFKTDTMTSKAHDGRLEMLLTDDMKRAHFEKLGVDYIFSPRFEDFKDLSCEAFVRDILCKKLHCVQAVCGEDFRFGKNALGDSKRLCELGEKYAIKTTVIRPLKELEQVISSTEIRKYIREGEIEKANEMLGYTFGFALPVEHGRQLARTMNFPTINQRIPRGLVLPRFGVYFTRVIVGEREYCGVTNIGLKPTLEIKTSPLAETYIFDFQEDIYGQNVQILLERFVRPETKFESIRQLGEQIDRDTQYAKKYFGII